MFLGISTGRTSLGIAFMGMLGAAGCAAAGVAGLSSRAFHITFSWTSRARKSYRAEALEMQIFREACGNYTRVRRRQQSRFGALVALQRTRCGSERCVRIARARRTPRKVPLGTVRAARLKPGTKWWYPNTNC